MLNRSPRRRPIFVITYPLILCALLVANTLSAATWLSEALFTSSPSVGGNSFTTISSFPTMRLSTGSYVGNGADNRQITGAGFQPEVVFVKCDCGQRGVIRTSTMSGDAAKVVGLIGNLLPDLIQSIDADGFTIGTDARVNNVQTYYWVAMKASASLKVGTYTGDGTDNRSITGVGFQPAWVITLGDGEDSWFRPSSLSGDASFAMDGNSQFSNRLQALEADGFQVGSDTNVNMSGVTYHYIAWKASSALSQGTYTGNAVDNRSITGIGFQPQFVWVKRTTANQSVWRPSSLSGDATLYWGATAGAANRIQALEADGFQIGTDAQVNTSAATYLYLALKNTP